MDINEFKKKIIEVEVNEKIAEEVLHQFNVYKNINAQLLIIDKTNKNKIANLLRALNKEVINVDFSYEDLSDVNLSDVTFVNCNFKFTNFTKANMDAIAFESCVLDNAKFCNAFMECAYFVGCSCIETDFSKSHLLASCILDSNWSRANVSTANLLEITAKNWNIHEMIIDKGTSVGEGEFYNVDWSKTNVSNMNITVDQVQYFLQCTNGGKYLQVYENYIPSLMQQREDAILSALWEEFKSSKQSIKDVQDLSDLIFLSYASEQQKIIEGFYHTNKSKYSLWMDLELVRASKLQEQIEHILATCKIAVIFLSKEYLIKAWTRYELLRLIDEKDKRDLKIIIVNMQSEILSDEILKYSNMKENIIVDNIKDINKYL